MWSKRALMTSQTLISKCLSHQQNQHSEGQTNRSWQCLREVPSALCKRLQNNHRPAPAGPGTSPAKCAKLQGTSQFFRALSNFLFRGTTAWGDMNFCVENLHAFPRLYRNLSNILYEQLVVTLPLLLENEMRMSFRFCLYNC